MKKILLFLIFISIISCKSKKSNTANRKDEYVRLFGTVTDFNNEPIDSVLIRVKNKNFENLYETLSDKNGDYSLQVKKGIYFSIYAIKEKDYGKSKLEYWAWNIPIIQNLEINPQYDKMEVYGIHVFEPKLAPYETYRIYFRPMSLSKSQRIKEIQKGDTLDIAPKRLTKNDLKVKVNNVYAEIMTIDKVIKYANSNYIYAYEIEVIKPKQRSLKNTENVNEYDKITIEINSLETNEKGKGECFIKTDCKSEKYDK